jgi:type II secretory pathway component PulJ
MNRQVRGFTLVEVLVTMVSASVLAISVGSLLFVASHNWRYSVDAVATQRNVELALDSISRAVRAADPSTVSTSPGELTVDTGIFRSEGGDLVYDPDTGTEGGEITLIEGRLSLFEPTLLKSRVRVALGASCGDYAPVVTSTVAFRREP